MTTRKQNDRANAAEIYKIGKRLEQVCEPLDGGMCAYKDGASDASIAEEIGCSKTSVANLRTQVFGKLREKKEAAVEPDADALKAALELQRAEIGAFRAALDVEREEIGRLKDQDAALVATVETLIDRLNRLIDNLAMNRSINATHLKIKQPKGIAPNLFNGNGGNA